MKRLIPEDVRNIISRLKMLGYEAYIIGGACREILSDRHHIFENKKVIKDFDIVTSATPEEIERAFGDCTTTCGNNFLVTLINDIEVATFRKDKADEAVIAHTLEEDVARRDFTINAVAFDVTKEIFIDHTGGIADLDNKILRFIGDPEKRIVEDPVRMLRGLRFASQYNLEIEAEAYFAIFQYRHLLKEIPAERIQLEVVKAFAHSNTHRFLTLLEELEMRQYVFPSLTYIKGKEGGKYHNETVLHHCYNAVKAVDKTQKVELKLACLYHDIGKYKHYYNDNNEIIFKDHCKQGLDFIEHDLKTHLKFPNETVSYVKHMANWHMDCVDSKRSIKRLIVKLTSANISIKDFLYLRYADNKGCVKSRTDFSETREKYREVIQIINEKPPFSVKALAINGSDLMQEYGLQQGKAIGLILKHVFDAVINEKVKNEKEDILTYINSVGIASAIN